MATATATTSAPRVTEVLSEEECYLAALLQDESGLDIAEFSWFEPENDDGCFRAWPFQWAWWRTTEPLQIDQCARSVGKTLSITVRMFAFPFVHAGQEAVITAPELVHLEPLTQLIERRFDDCRLGREIRPRGKSAVTHRPFMMLFHNGARIIGRIPQRDGKGVKGIHPLWLELDEAQDYPKAGWTELTETLKRGFEGAVWRAHGVTRGVRDKFYDFTQDTPDNDWHVHRMTAMHRPNWTSQEREEKIKQYGGSRHDPDFRRNVYGLHGDQTNPLFVLHRLMRCVDNDESSDYNLDEYFRVEIRAEQLEDSGAPIAAMLDFPPRHHDYSVFWCGMDVGYTADPSEILVFAEYHPSAAERKANEKANITCPPEGQSRLKLLTRISLFRIEAPQQVEAILAVLNFYKPKGFAMDKTGNGLPLYQSILHEIREASGELIAARHAMDLIKGYNFSEKVLVDIDNVSMSSDDMDELVKESGIQRNVLEYSTDKLREYVDAGRWLMPWDKELIQEFQGQTFQYSKAGIDAYGRRRRIFSEGTFHALDGARMAAMGHAQATIEEITKERPAQPVLDSFIAV